MAQNRISESLPRPTVIARDLVYSHEHLVAF